MARAGKGSVPNKRDNRVRRKVLVHCGNSPRSGFTPPGSRQSGREAGRLLEPLLQKGRKATGAGMRAIRGAARRPDRRAWRAALGYSRLAPRQQRAQEKPASR